MVASTDLNPVLEQVNISTKVNRYFPYTEDTPESRELFATFRTFITGKTGETCLDHCSHSRNGSFKTMKGMYRRPPLHNHTHSRV